MWNSAAEAERWYRTAEDDLEFASRHRSPPA